MQSQQGPSIGFTWFALFLRSLAVPLEVIAHRGHGARYFDLRTGAAAILIWFIPLFFPAANPLPARAFFLLYLVMLLHARFQCWRLHRDGYAPHSRYNGLPLLCRWLPSWSESTIKRFVEPALAVLVGWIVGHASNPPLGLLVAGCGLSAFFDAGSAQVNHDSRRMDMRDAVIDAELWREIR